MTKSELVALLSDRQPHLVPGDVQAAVNHILAAIGRALQAGRRIELRGFGSSTTNFRHPREGRNPKTGQPVSIPGKNRVRFKASKIR